MRISIWGSLNYGNFGDDVMNIIFANHLKSLGCQVVLYRLSERLSKQYELQTSNNLDEFLGGADYCIIGGGSWLESRKLGDSYEKDFFELKEKLEDYKIPLYVISIGGDENSNFENLTKDRQQLFSSFIFKGGTVRLKSDLEVFKKLNCHIRYYPDIVIQSSNNFLTEEGDFSSKRFKIGLSVKNNNETKSFVRKFKFSSMFSRRYEITFINTHLPEYDFKYEYKHRNESNLLKNYQYEKLESFYNFLRSMDLIVCSKLHPGVAALSVGTPFIWLGGLGKTKSFLESVNLSQYEYTTDNIFSLIITEKLHEVVKNYEFSEVKRQKSLAKNHLNYLTELIKY